MLPGPAVLAFAPEGCSHWISVSLPRMTPSNNEIKGMHHFVYRKVRKAWRELVAQAVPACVLGAGLKRSWLVIERHSSGSLDWDNAYGGLKPLLDCLVMPTPRNPDGLGLLENDGVLNIPHPPLLLQHQVKRKDQKTIIHFFQLQ